MALGSRNTLILLLLLVGGLVAFLYRPSSDVVIIVTAHPSSRRQPPSRNVNEMPPDEETNHKNSDGATEEMKAAAAATETPVHEKKTMPHGASAAAVKGSEPPAGALETTQIQLDDLMPWTGDMRNPCCRAMRAAAIGLLGVPSDIGLLLPILAAYQREDDIRTVVELGSRLGSSTMTMIQQMTYDPSKQFATVDLEIRQPVSAMYKCEQICSDASGLKGKRKFFFVEGNDLQTPIPFVDNSSSGSSRDKNNSRPIDLLFIDTLHHAALLKMELQRYPKYVRKYLVFHDSYSFRTRNEGPRGFKPPGWPVGERVPIGLEVVLREFLEANKEEWVEEMNNVHNNGFFVIRRKDVAPSAYPWVMTAVQPRYSGIAMEPQASIEKLLGQGRLLESPDTKCNRAYDDMYKHLGVTKEKISPPCHQAPGFSLRSDITPLYNLLIASPDNVLPLAPLLGVIASQVTAPFTLNENAQVLVMGCEVCVANAALHGALQARKVNVRFFASVMLNVEDAQSRCSTDNMVKYLRRSDGVLERNAKFLDGGAQSIDVMVMSAEAVSKLSNEDAMRVDRAVKHRIVVYGTNLFNIHRQAHLWTGQLGEGEPRNSDMHRRANLFELRMGFAKGVGMAMLERRFSTAFAYAPNARPKAPE